VWPELFPFSHLNKLADILHLFIRCFLQIGSHSTMLAPLFTETGILPLRYRRVTLAIACLLYLLQLPPAHYAYAALQESISLLRKGYSCWIADINWVLHHLPGADSAPNVSNVENMLDCGWSGAPSVSKTPSLPRTACSQHTLAAERLRCKERYYAPVPRVWRLCCFCRCTAEDVVHMLLECQGHPHFSQIRLAMQADVHTLSDD
jgi:hypothetical protein